MRCPNCHRDVPDDVSSCPHCGGDMQTPEVTVTTPADDVVAPVDGAALDAVISPGMVLAEQYEVLQRIGSGDMGEVWKTMDLELETIVAIKVLPPELARNPLSVRRLRREAMIGQRLTHPAICRLYGFHSASEIKFIVMEYVEGETLQQVLAARLDGRAGWDQVKTVLRQVALALDFAHRVAYRGSVGHEVRGVLHRAITPSNIMVTSSGQTRLMDFGIAYEIHSTMTHLTGKTGFTPLYASPEQFRGDVLTPASDIYSFAAVAYECLAGHRYIQPHGDLKYQILENPYRPIEGVSSALNRVLEKGLAKQPQDRPASAREVMDLLDAAFAQGADVDIEEASADGTDPRKRPSPPSSTAPPARRVALTADQLIGRPVHTFPAVKVLKMSALAAAVLAVVLVLALFLGPSDDPARQTTDSDVKSLQRKSAALLQQVKSVDASQGVGADIAKLEELREQAERARQDGRLDEASDIYTRLIDRAQRVIALDRDRTVAAQYRRGAEAAREDYEKAVGGVDLERMQRYSGPSWQKVTDLADRARRLSDIEDYEGAVKAWQHAVAMLGKAVVVADEAWRAENAERIDETYRKHMEAGRRALKAGDLTMAAAQAELALKLRRDDPDALALKRQVEKNRLPDRLVLKVAPGVTIDCVLVRPGVFTMGSSDEEPHRMHDERAHEVTMSRPYYIAATEVTQKQYEALMKKNPSVGRGPDRPVDSVSYSDAMGFCRVLSDETGRNVTLPTEAQWEYAARAGTKTAYAFGDDVKPGQAVFVSGRASSGSAEVAKRSANAWKIFDMHGNVQEWCRDGWTDYPAGKRTDPVGPAEGDRVVRGGSWSHHPAMGRSAARNVLSRTATLPNTGFRIVVQPDQAPAAPGGQPYGGPGKDAAPPGP